MDKETIIRGWAESQRGAPYVFGGTGRRCTPEYRRERILQYPAHQPAIQAACPVLSGTKLACQGCRYEGMACFDCAQFTRRALETVGITIPSGASSQWLSDSWAEKGAIANMPRDRVCVLYRESGDRAFPMAHTGLYLGNGQAMDARGHMQGVLMYEVAAYPWTHYAIPHGMEMDAVIRQGMRGEAVRSLQQLLLACGYPLPRCGADGAFGQETLKALNTFQRDNSLPQELYADKATLALLSDMAQKTTPKDADTLEERLKALEDMLAGCRACPHRAEACA